MNDFELIRLGIDDDRDPQFDCGNNDLNEFFLKDSRTSCNQLLSITYAWVNNGQVLAFFSVSNDAITRETNRSAFKRIMSIIPREKRYSTMLAVKIGRLGVDKNYHSNGLGSKVLDFIKGWFISENKTGCRFIIVDALNKPDILPFL